MLRFHYTSYGFHGIPDDFNKNIKIYTRLSSFDNVTCDGLLAFPLTGAVLSMICECCAKLSATAFARRFSKMKGKSRNGNRKMQVCGSIKSEVKKK